jgi:hypothetical protein
MEFAKGTMYRLTSTGSILSSPTTVTYTSTQENELYLGDVVHFFIVLDEPLIVGLLESEIGPLYSLEQL